MKRKLTDLVRIRKDRDIFKEMIVDAQVELEATEEYQVVQTRKELYMDFKVKADVLADEIRDEAIVEFLSTFPPKDRKTKPYDGIQIKEFKTIEVTDEKKAIKWAVEGEQFNLVSLMKSNFNKVAKVLDLDFVKKGKEYRAQIASDLSMYEDTEDE